MKKRSKQILTLFILGLVLILLAPYVPDFCFRVLLAAKEKLFDYRYWDIRFEQIIPSVRMGGIILSAWGMALLLKKEDKEWKSEFPCFWLWFLCFPSCLFPFRLPILPELQFRGRFLWMIWIPIQM